MAAGIDGEVAALEHRFGLGLFSGPAAQHRTDAGNEHPGAEGLGEIVVGPQLETGDDIGLFAPGGEHQDGDRAGGGIAL